MNTKKGTDHEEFFKCTICGDDFTAEELDEDFHTDGEFICIEDSEYKRLQDLAEDHGVILRTEEDELRSEYFRSVL